MSKTDTVARFSLIFAQKVHFSENSSVRENFCQKLAEDPTYGEGCVGRWQMVAAPTASWGEDAPHLAMGRVPCDLHQL